MNQHKRAAMMACLLLVTTCSIAAEKDIIRIKVLDSETRSVSLGAGDVSTNCDQVNFDAYCHNSKSTRVTNTLLVQEGTAPPFRVSCIVDSKFSRCTPLPKGESFDAKTEKRGLEIYYVDGKGKVRGQLYTPVDTDGKSSPPATAAATQRVAAAEAQPKSSPAPALAPSVVPAQQSSPEKPSEKVKCNFTSTPPGADITVDGNYVGSTPSEIPLSTGAHAVVVSMAGFVEWKRELTVEAGAIVNVTANLQKTDQ